ncbi:MAG: translation initiation factor IF-2 [bacterium]|nr:translation initiation factor IF-2 [bacterium]
MPKAKKTEKETPATRPPIVVVVGHIDHGKTSLLDHIRKTSVAEKETGGITQHIGAYQTGSGAKRITFIDTPGHEAFSAMRTRGTRVADIAVLVVAADEGVKPQTEEAIRTIREAELPFVVAINKSDKPNADPLRVKNQLAESSVLVEGFGGTVPVVELSAKTGEGVESLLETILLLAELEELKTDPAKPGEGVVIESHLDPKRGATATLLVEDGTVTRGSFIAVGGEITPVRMFENFRGETVETAQAGEPIRIIGFPRVPALGEAFRTFAARREAEAWIESAGEKNSPAAVSGGPAGPAKGDHVVNIVLKTDVLGSEEAIMAALGNIRSPELSNRIVKNEVGDINESDIKLAAATNNTFIVGFRVKLAPAMKELAERSGVTVVAGDIIYELLDAVKAAMLALAPTEVKRVDLGRAKILGLFRRERAKQIVGGKVESGSIRNRVRFDIIRNGVPIGAGRILELQANRRSAEEVPEGQEFGIQADSETAVAIGDTLVIFTEESVTPTL